MRWWLACAVMVGLGVSACASSDSSLQLPVAEPAVTESAVEPSATREPVVTPSPAPTAASLVIDPTTWPAPDPMHAPCCEREPIDGFEKILGYEGLALAGAVNLWTGDELIFWGGASGSSDDAAASLAGSAYNPATKTWRTLPPAPGRPYSEVAGVWTGSEMVICCGGSGQVRNHDALAYSPVTDSWRTFPGPQFVVPTWGASAVWAGDAMVVGSHEELAIWRPGSDEWEISDAPANFSASPGASMVATDHGVVIWPRLSQRTGRQGWVFDPSTTTWTKLPALPAGSWPAMPEVVWTGSELIVVGGLPGASGEAEQMVGARFDFATGDTGEWTPLPAVFPGPIPFEGNLGSLAAVWLNNQMVVYMGSLSSGIDPLDPWLVSFDPATDEWSKLGEVQAGWNPPMLPLGEHLAIAAAGELLLSTTDLFDLAEPIADAGVPPVPRTVFDDLNRSAVARVPLTLVGHDVQAAMVVIDLGLGLRTVYPQAELAHQGHLSGYTIDRARRLLLWHTTTPTSGHRGGAAFGGEGDRLSFGELSQEPTVIDPGGLWSDRSIWPTPDATAFWSWEYVDDQTSRARLVDMTTGTELAVAVIPRAWPVGVLPDLSLVVGRRGATGESDGAIRIDSSGQISEGTDQRVVGLAGWYLLLQDCPGCPASVLNVQTGTTIAVEASEGVTLSSAGGPIWPTNAPPLTTASPGGALLLVAQNSLVDERGDESGEASLLAMAVVDMATGTLTPLIDGADATSSFGTWSRDGRYVVLVGDILQVIDLRTGRVATVDAVPDGFGILAAG